MSLASTAFMAAPGGYSTELSTKLDKIDMSQLLAAVLVQDKELLGHIKMGSVGTNIEHNWIEDELNPMYVMASGSATNKITCSVGYGTTSLTRILRRKTVINPAGSEILVQLTASASALSNTVAIYGSTSWVAWTMTKCYIVAQPWADIDSASSDISQSRTKRKNYMQVFENAVEITQTRKNMSMEAVVNELQLQSKYRTMEIKRMLDMSVIRGYAYASDTSIYSGDLEHRTMAGLIQLIRDYDLDATNEDTTVTQASAALTIGHINSLAYKIFSAGGLDEQADPIIVVGPKQQRIIAGFESELRRVEQGERKVGYYRDVFMTDMGVEMPVVLDRWFPNDKLIILDRNRVALIPMKGDAWHLEKMAKTGRNEKWQLSGQYTLELRNADKCHGLLYDLR